MTRAIPRQLLCHTAKVFPRSQSDGFAGSYEEPYTIACVRYDATDTRSVAPQADGSLPQGTLFIDAVNSVPAKAPETGDKVKVRFGGVTIAEGSVSAIRTLFSAGSIHHWEVSISG